MTEEFEIVEDESLIIGSGGKSGGGSDSQTEDPDSLFSRATVALLDLVGEGEIGGLVDGAKSIYLNNTPLLRDDGKFNFKRVKWDFRPGTQSQSMIDLPDGEQFGIETPHTLGQEILIGNAAVITIVNPNIDAVRLILEFPALSEITEKGDIVGSEVKMRVLLGTDGATPTLYRDITVKGKSGSKFQRKVLVKLPPGNTWTIRVTRLTNDATSVKIQNKSFIAAYVEVQNSKLNYPNSAVAMVRVDPRSFSSIPSRSYLVDGLKIRIPSNYNTATNTYGPVWDGTFQIAVSSNPAWILYDVLTNTRYGLGNYIQATQIDKTALYKIGKYCDELVPNGEGGFEKRFTINTTIHETKEAYKLISDLTSAFRGMAYWSGGLVGFTQDAPADPVMTFTNANVIDGVFNYTGAARADKHSVVLVSWNDPAEKYRQKIEYVEDRDLIALYGYRKLETISFGCTSRAQANRAGRWILYTEKFESNLINFKTGLDSSLLLPGQIIMIHDQFRAGKRLGGRITEITNFQCRIDTPLNINFATVPTITLIRPDGTIVDRAITQGAEPDILVFATAIGGELPQLDSVFVITEPNFLEPVYARVLGIQADKSGVEFTITCVEHNPQKYLAVEQGVAITQPPTSLLPSQFLPPSNIIFSPAAYPLAAGGFAIRLDVSWEGAWETYTFAWRRTDAAGLSNWTYTTVNQAHTEILNAQVGLYEVEVTGQTSLGRKSPAVTASFNLTAGIIQGTIKPEAPFGLTTQGDFKAIILRWSNTEQPESVSTEIWEADTDNLAAASLNARVKGNWYTRTGLDQSETKYYWIRDNNGWNVSDFNSTLGTPGTTLSSSAYMKDVLINDKLIEDQIAENAITSVQLADNAVTATSFAQEIRPVKVVNSLPTTAAEGDQAFLTTDGKLYRYAFNSTLGVFQWTRATDGADIVANSITSGQIAAGAIKAGQIDTNAVTTNTIAAGAVTTNQLAVGVGGNRIQNSDASAGLDFVRLVQTSGAVFSNIQVWGKNYGLLNTDPLAIWAPLYGFTFAIPESSSGLNPDNNFSDLYFDYPTDFSPSGLSAIPFPVEVGRYYEFSAYTGAHRCKMQIILFFVDVAGTVILTVIGPTSEIINDAEKLGGSFLGDWKRIFLRAQAPANAVAAYPVVRKYSTKPGFTDSVGFVTRVMLTETFPFATELVPWGPGGVTLIGPGSVVTTNLITRSAQISDAIITRAKIGTAQVGTLQVEGNAITAPESITPFDYSYGPINSGANQATGGNDIAFLPVTTVDIACRRIVFVCFTFIHSDSDPGYVTITVRNVNTGENFIRRAVPGTRLIPGIFGPQSYDSWTYQFEFVTAPAAPTTFALSISLFNSSTAGVKRWQNSSGVLVSDITMVCYTGKR